MHKISKQFALWWILIIVSAFILQLLTISFLPGIGQDEVQITDYGRLSVSPYSDWSITWLIGSEKPLLLWSYLGPLIAEEAYQIGGPSGIGPRIASLLGGLLAASAGFGWLLARKVPKFIALCIGTAFLLDPLFILSQRMGRSDSWVIALCLTACWVLRSSQSKNSASAKTLLMLAGALTASASLVWPSAFLLYPLVFFELWNYLRSVSSRKEKLFQSFRFIAGGVIAIVLLLFPIRQNLNILFSDMIDVVAFNVDASKSPFEKTTAIFSINNWYKVVKTFIKTFSPALPLLGILSLFYRRQIGLKMVTLLSVVMIFTSLIYEFRLIYLLPYFFALGSGIFINISEKSISRLGYRIGKSAIVFALVWSVSVSIYIRSGLAWKNGAPQEREQINKVAESFIGKGNYKVFLAFTYEFYFAGRALGWQLYTPYLKYTYDSLGNWRKESEYQPKNKFVKLLSKMDYAIFSKGSVTNDVQKQLIESGLIYTKTFVIKGNKTDQNKSVENRTKEILLSFLYGYKNYGPYILYERKNKL